MTHVLGKISTIGKAGDELPVRNAKFWLPDTPKHRKMKVKVRKDGTYNFGIWLYWDEHIVCRNGRVDADKWVFDKEVIVTAKGCEVHIFKITKDTRELNITLVCDR